MEGDPGELADGQVGRLGSIQDLPDDFWREECEWEDATDVGAMDTEQSSDVRYTLIGTLGELGEVEMRARDNVNQPGVRQTESMADMRALPTKVIGQDVKCSFRYIASRSQSDRFPPDTTFPRRDLMAAFGKSELHSNDLDGGAKRRGVSRVQPGRHRATQAYLIPAE